MTLDHETETEQPVLKRYAWLALGALALMLALAVVAGFAEGILR